MRSIWAWTSTTLGQSAMTGPRSGRTIALAVQGLRRGHCDQLGLAQIHTSRLETDDEQRARQILSELPAQPNREWPPRYGPAQRSRFSEGKTWGTTALRSTRPASWFTHRAPLPASQPPIRLAALHRRTAIGAETAATAAQPRVEQVAHRVAEHVQAVHDKIGRASCRERV